VKTARLTKLYGCVIGVNDLTLELPPGVHGLLGPNGAGKSTFLKLITGQLRPTEGEIRVFGERPWNNPGLFKRVGFCPEQDAFYDFLTGLEFVSTLARMSGLDGPSARQRARTVLERCGAAEYMDRKISTYSRGMRQRTKVAQALVHEPEFIILDEPLTATDPVGRHELMELIEELHREGRSILVSSHVLHEVEAMTDDFLLIYGGRVLASGNIHEIRTLMDEYPHRISIRCDRPRELGHLLMRDLPVTGIEVTEQTGSLSVLTSAPRAFYEKLPEIALASGVRVEEMVSLDDNLQAVFTYLVGGE
jgi:ABC-2 type transport system ATP-binding protein